MIARLRAAARAALPKGAFLRRDRGDALFVTDAPRLCPDGGWRETLAAAGFLADEAGGLARLSPGPTWLQAMERQTPEPPNPFCASLSRFAGIEPEAESLALFALGVKALERPEDSPRFERRLRQRAAECLRMNATNPIHGGGLYACALLTTMTKEADR